jgi:Ser/Thr protein kinase RdoA (MazF antagonist)
MNDANIPLSTTTGPQTSPEKLKEYLEDCFVIKIQKTNILDLNVHRVEIDDGPTWIVRIFTQSYKEVEDLAKILEYLQQQGFPAEACVSQKPVSDFSSDERILITGFAEGSRPERNRRTFRRLGQLLGRLHSLPLPEGLRRGGAWHHLSTSGGMSEECEAAKMKLDTFKAQTAVDKHEHIDRLKLELSAIDRLKGLPLAIVHPDFVPANVIENSSTDDWTIIDWAGAGCGPRLTSLGPLLMAAGARGKLILVDSVMSGYDSHVNLDISELDHLSTTIRARPLAMACWEVSVGRKDPAEVVQGLPTLFELADNIARRIGEIAKKT